MAEYLHTHTAKTHFFMEKIQNVKIRKKLKLKINREYIFVRWVFSLLISVSLLYIKKIM